MLMFGLFLFYTLLSYRLVLVFVAKLLCQIKILSFCQNVAINVRSQTKSDMHRESAVNI